MCPCARRATRAPAGGVVADKFIAVSGNIGVGKTSLVRHLTTDYGMTPVYEPFADNPYLDDFYADMKQWSFHSQIWFLSHKFRLHRELQETPGVLVQDRTIYEDAEIFATYLHRSRRMSKRDLDTYMELYRAMQATLQPPDLMIYLRCSVRAIRKRIRQRGRPSEQNIPLTYLRRLNELYEDWISRYEGPVLIWDSERADYLTHLVDRLEFERSIRAVL
ncbi:MAG: deoxynucleoside kinase [Myxococcales bacterium]|nr:deoxynucleoside kinase [Myxococcales bacterium]MCB9672444.1 deoxynucleoside kinase [Alphaproteobacteria bacterium]MCB9692874.1 deoxynucleoside kinase [Alphaproteobacteria bacterium]